MLKAEMHTHCKDDPEDVIKYSAEELIEEAAKQGFDVLSITLHKKLFYPRRYVKAAKKHGILLIPGVELRLEDCDVLAYNVTASDVKGVKKLNDLNKIRRKETLIVAPHPFLPLANSLKGKFNEYHALFDAIEHTFFYHKYFRFWNKKAIAAGKYFNIPVVGNSDVHKLWNLGNTYTLIDSKKDKASVIAAIKAGKVKLVSKPLLTRRFLEIPYKEYRYKLPF
ncbi:PHP-associated domain-containing protein [Nanoarchaeota archaeon]